MYTTMRAGCAASVEQLWRLHAGDADLAKHSAANMIVWHRLSGEYQLELERYDRLFGIGESPYLPPSIVKIKAVDEPDGLPVMRWK